MTIAQSCHENFSIVEATKLISGHQSDQNIPEKVFPFHLAKLHLAMCVKKRIHEFEKIKDPLSSIENSSQLQQ